MISERQRIEAAPSPSVENHVPSPPAYEEVSGVFASQTQNGATDSMGYFLGEVSLQASLAAVCPDYCLSPLFAVSFLLRKRVEDRQS